MEIQEIGVVSVIGLIGSHITKLFGGWSVDLQTLLFFMAIDFIMGLVVAAFFQNSTKSETGALSSTAGWKGLCKKGITFLLVLVAHRLDMTLGLDYIQTATVIAFIVVELISIIENAGLMGVPIPKVITSVIDVLKKKAGEQE